MPQDVADGEFRTGRLERVLPEYAVRGGAYYLLMPSSRLIPGHVVLFRDFLLEHLTSFWAQVAVACTERRAALPAVNDVAATRVDGATASAPHANGATTRVPRDAQPPRAPGVSAPAKRRPHRRAGTSRAS